MKNNVSSLNMVAFAGPGGGACTFW